MLLICGAGKDSWESLVSARRSNQSILKEISTEYSLEGLMLKLKLQNFGHLMGRTDSLEKTLMLGKIEHGRRRGRQRMRWLDGITNSMDMSLSKLGGGEGQGSLVCCSPVGHKESDTTEWLNWTDICSGWSSTKFLVNFITHRKKIMGLKESDTTERLNWLEKSTTAENWS